MVNPLTFVLVVVTLDAHPFVVVASAPFCCFILSKSCSLERTLPSQMLFRRCAGTTVPALAPANVTPALADGCCCCCCCCCCCFRCSSS
uniref:Putative secreted protein n=1 Tax=Anopheles darlingi TaxID=43151 RepID=A0A2M4D9E7_ANODA